MIQFSQENDSQLNTLLDKLNNGLIIEQYVADGMSYLEATTTWLEENSVLPTQYNKYIPPAIIDKITKEVLDDNVFRPSIAKSYQTSTLEFLE